MSIRTDTAIDSELKKREGQAKGERREKEKKKRDNAMRIAMSVSER